MKKLGFLGIFMSLLGTFGCGANFDPASRVSSFRVLAVEADAPFARPGETVTLTSLSYDPEGRSVNWAWAACVNPPSSTVEGCLTKISTDTALGKPTIITQGTGQDSFTYTVPDDALSSLPEEARRAALVGVVNVACPGNLDLEGSTENLPFRCLDATTGRALGLDEFVVGLKRISVRDNDRNQNPVLSRVVFDGADWPAGEVKQVSPCDTDGNDFAACSSGSKHQLGAYVTPESFESGQDQFGLAFSEQLIVEHYATEGIFEYEIRIAENPVTGFVARKAAAGKDLNLWFVVHDDRGGATWTERQLHVE